jgi:hypothetical protein
MEAERPKVDRKILEFVKNYVFDPADFTIRATAFAGLIPKWLGYWLLP